MSLTELKRNQAHLRGDMKKKHAAKKRDTLRKIRNEKRKRRPSRRLNLDDALDIELKALEIDEKNALESAKLLKNQRNEIERLRTKRR